MSRKNPPDIPALVAVAHRLSWLAGHFSGVWLSQQMRAEGVKYKGTASAVSIAVIDEQGRQIDVAADLLRLSGEMQQAIYPMTITYPKTRKRK